MMERVRLSGLDSREYEHPFDHRALAALTGTPGLETLVRKFNEYGLERIFRIQYTGSNLRVTPRNFPELDSALREACDLLDIAAVPDLYVQWDYSIGAFTAGVEHPLIVLNSGCVDLLSYPELLCILGHELGHIKSCHVLYHQMGIAIPVLGEIIGSMTFGIGNLVSAGLELALREWHRMSEFTADRASLLTCQDVHVAARVLVKAAGMPLKYQNHAALVDEFITQARQFEDFDFSTLDRVAKLLITAGQSHPWTVLRANEFYKWIDSGGYEQVLGRGGKQKALPGSPPPVRA